MIAVALLAAGPAEAARRPMTVDDQFRLAEPGLPLLSPDGRWVLYTVERLALAENARHTTTWLAPAAEGAGAPRELLREGDTAPMWSPSSRSVFFLRAVGDGAQRSRELFEQPVEGGEAVQLSHVGPGPDGQWQMAPDGRSFIVLRQEEKASGPGADTDVVFVDEGSNGQTRDHWMNVWRFDVATRALARVTQRDWWINGADVAPDGRTAVVAAQPDNQRNTRWKTELFAVDLETGAVRPLTHNQAPELNPRFSPDGRSVLFSAVRLDRWENGNGDLWLLDVATGATRNLTPGHRGRFAAPVFSSDGRVLFLQSGDGTTRFPVQVDVATGRITSLADTEAVMRVGSWSGDRRTYAYVYTDAATPADVYIGRTDARGDRQRRVTDLNAWVRDEIALGSVQRVQWPSDDGRTIDGLLTLPAAERRPSGPLPLIVHVPCGPGCAWLNSFSAKQQVYAGLGYAQLAVNVRGASNYDDFHMLGNRFDIGGGDRRDLEAGVDAMVARGIADPERLALSGWSYGAVLGGFTLTRSTRYKAATLGAMVSDFVSEFGATVYYDMERWYLGGTPWSEPEQWRGRSALTHADRVRTPTLLHHGDDDTTCSPFQSMNFFAALRYHGTPARLLRYPGEGHDFRQPAHLKLRDDQDVAWMERYVMPAPPSARPRSPARR